MHIFHTAIGLHPPPYKQVLKRVSLLRLHQIKWKSFSWKINHVFTRCAGDGASKQKSFSVYPIFISQMFSILAGVIFSSWVCPHYQFKKFLLQLFCNMNTVCTIDFWKNATICVVFPQYSTTVVLNQLLEIWFKCRLSLLGWFCGMLWVCQISFIAFVWTWQESVLLLSAVN